MTRTYRTHPAKTPFYFTAPSDEGFQAMLEKGGWKLAKKILPKEEYGRLKAFCGDKVTRSMSFSGVPHWFRNVTEKQYRQAAKIALQQFHMQEDYDFALRDKPDSVDWYYDY